MAAKKGRLQSVICWVTGVLPDHLSRSTAIGAQSDEAKQSQMQQTQTQALSLWLSWSDSQKALNARPATVPTAWTITGPKLGTCSVGLDRADRFNASGGYSSRFVFGTRDERK